MPKWQYTLTSTVEIEVPADIVDQDDFIDWLAEHPDSRTADFQIVDSFVGEAHRLEAEGSEGQDREVSSDDQDRESYLDNYIHDSDMEDR
jgi:hypothetical protein